ncbi:hypothetical protein Aperf_G00000094090 [Anoplocephala perfoliata]
MSISGQNIFLVTGIPAKLKTSDLRRVFSQHIEAAAFGCFHYRHRPTSSRISLLSESSLDLKALFRILKQHRTAKAKVCTAILSIKPDLTDCVLSSFEDSWCTDEKCGCYPPCKFFPLTYDSSQIDMLKKLCEFNPPSWMPQGNVGTQTSHFFFLIKSCQLSPALIKSLQLDFPSLRNNRKYGTVPYKYDGDNAMMTESNSDAASETEDRNSEITIGSGLILSNPVPEDEVAEEWDRFESLHDDPYNVDRSANHSLKYESKIELKWEKGGSGLVFYTDEQFWRDRESVRKDEFFNEPASFDWDVNMQHYSDDEGLAFTGPGGPDLDRKQIAQMLGDSDSDSTSKPYSSAYGERIMRRQGWRKGLRLGHPKRKGLLEPLTSEDGFVSTNRSGVGFITPSIRPRLKRNLILHRPSPSGANIRANRMVITSSSSSLGFEGVKFQSGGTVNPQT